MSNRFPTMLPATRDPQIPADDCNYDLLYGLSWLEEIFQWSERLRLNAAEDASSENKCLMFASNSLHFY